MAIQKSVIARRIRELTPSPTLGLDAVIKGLIAKGEDVVNLCLGEPDFPTPDNIVEAAIVAMKQGKTHYTATAGIVELREAICQKLKHDNGLIYTPAEIAVGVGSKQLLYNAIMTLVESGDEVLLPTPTWSTYAEQIKLAGGKVVLVPLKSPFKLKCEDLKPFVTTKTKLLVINSPNNPTGAVIDSNELQKIAKLAAENNLWVITDEIYEKLIYEDGQQSIASFGKTIKERTITINGFSKSYAMTGWRVGYAAGPKEVIEAMVALQGQTTSNTSSIGQYAATAALKGKQESLVTMKGEFAKRRSFVINEFKKIKGIEVVEPEGAFYLFFGIEKLLNKQYPNSSEWCQGLLEKAKVALVPGEAFFAPGWVRLSFASSETELIKALKRIKAFVGED